MGGALGYFSSGSGGDPKQVFFDESDWRASVAHRADCLRALGLGAGEVAAVALPFGPWFSGDHLTDALLAIGARVLPTGIHGAHLPGIARLLERIGATALVATPTTALALSAAGAPQKLRHLITVGEALPENLSARLEDAYGIRPRALFAASEAILGFADLDFPDFFHWDPDRLHLEVLRDDGGICNRGVGELLVTRRYGTATPILRYRLGDRVELNPAASGRPLFRHLGRTGHAFSLATGVAVSRAQLDAFLDQLGCWVGRVDCHVYHGDDGRDTLAMRLEGGSSLPAAEEIKRCFETLTPEVTDLIACGYLTVMVKRERAKLPEGKRRFYIDEGPWRL